MNIPYYRYVRDADDGCGIDQCLNCGATWEWRGGSGKVKYCMYCGVKFRSELHCRDHETPRWMYEYRQRHGDECFINWNNGGGITSVLSLARAGCWRNRRSCSRVTAATII